MPPTGRAVGPFDVVVVGEITRDLALRLAGEPAVGASTAVVERREMLGGKGANQAVAAAQLGARVGLLGVVGDDAVGDQLLATAAADGIDTASVARRVDAPTGLIVDVVDDRHRWRYLEHRPEALWVTAGDVAAAEPAIRVAASTVVQLQQPAPAALAAARLARDAGGRVVLDGAVGGAARDELLRLADVVRADDQETALLAGSPVRSVDDARRTARALVEGFGVSVVAFAVGSDGNLVVWDGGDVLVPLTGGPV
ncbi:MAG TPA: PfkB family carbohydrate kinase, partial [Acidimicrobiales bacterium]|nr:PfkB family carbohydrate kinase [Acidimicrobiales bacterium]